LGVSSPGEYTFAAPEPALPVSGLSHEPALPWLAVAAYYPLAMVPPVPSLRAVLLASLGIGGCLVIGCDIHDEPVRPAAATTDQLLRGDTPLLVDMLNRDSDAPAIKPTTLEYVDGFDAGLKRAATESKPLLVICRAAWCRWSAEMTQGTLADPRIIQLATRFVCVMVDADRHAATCHDLGVTAFPTVIVLTSSGQEKLRSVGRPATHKLADALEATLRPAIAARPGLPLK
jgi:hypothetical protein